MKHAKYVFSVHNLQLTNDGFFCLWTVKFLCNCCFDLLQLLRVYFIVAILGTSRLSMVENLGSQEVFKKFLEMLENLVKSEKCMGLRNCVA